jgi:uncharacterized protein with HEPN domain
MRPDSAALLWDVREAAVRIGVFISGLEEPEYLDDELRRSAVERQLEIIGEALNGLRKADQEVASRIPDINRIVGLRNVLAHGYAVVDDRVVWIAAHDRIPELLARVENVLGELPPAARI